MVGSGVAKGVEYLKDFCVKGVFCRENKRELLGDLLYTDYKRLIDCSGADTIVETLGGNDFALECIMYAMERGKNVVTSNKEVVSKNFKKLMSLARQKNVAFLFEGAVGGAVPIIDAICDIKKRENITDIAGIINGTTNYVLSQMQSCDVSFEQALCTARQKGFAEADSSADIFGFDMQRKICILANLAFDIDLDIDSIAVNSLIGVNSEILEDVKAKGYLLRYIAQAQRCDNGDLTAMVIPCLVSS